jgi:putative NIF3 family GTP cyclohydrolase 1 type 2
MKRREFIELAGAASAGAIVTGAGPASSSGAGRPSFKAGAKPLLAKDVAAYLRSLAEVVEPSVDRIVIGDPETEVAGIGTCWLPYWETCRQAVRDGVNLLIVHEPTFYTHWDLDEKSEDLFAASAAGKKAYLKAVETKKDWIEANNLVVIRCHDVLDKIGGFGIPYAFGKLLGFGSGDIIRSEPYYNVYRTGPKPAIEVARAIARRMAEVRQPGVAFYGDRDRAVSSVGVGTGCFSDPIEFMGLAPDLFIAIDDIVRTWTQTVYARDTGHPLVVVNHGATEEAGVRGLAEFLTKTYPGRKVVHYPQGCGYEWVTAGPAAE